MVKSIDKAGEKQVVEILGIFQAVKLRHVSGNWVKDIKPSFSIETVQKFDIESGVLTTGIFRLSGTVNEVSSASDGFANRSMKLQLHKHLELAAEKFKLDSTELSVRINSTIKRGADWLKKQCGKEALFQDKRVGYIPGTTALALTAMMHAGIPTDDTVVAASLAGLSRTTPTDTYDVAASLQAIETKYLPLERSEDVSSFTDESAREKVSKSISREDAARVHKLATMLVQYQERTGTWGYPRQGQTYDHSNSHYALLALKSASRCGFKVPPVVWRAAAEHFVDAQNLQGASVKLNLEVWPGRELAVELASQETETLPGGWGYLITRGVVSHREFAASGTMTCAGLTSLLICESELERVGELPDGLRKRINIAKRQGLAWLQRNYSVRTVKPESGMWSVFHYYYLFGLERVGLLYGIKKIGGHDWYLEGAAYLVNAQREDGSWLSCGEMPIIDTAFALLFLKKAVLPVTTPASVKTGDTKK